MAEHQSCAGLVNASALCAIRKEVKGDSVNVIAEISAELQGERQKNAELLEKISLLEAQIQERDDKEFLLTDGHGSSLNVTEKYITNFKRQKIEISDRIENGYAKKVEMASKAVCRIDANFEGRLVNWMSMEETQLLHFDEPKDGESAADCDDTDETEDEDDDCLEDYETNTDLKSREIDENVRTANELKEQLDDEGFHPGMLPCQENLFGAQREPTVPNLSQKRDRMKDFKPPYKQAVHDQRDIRKPVEKGVIKTEECKVSEEILISTKEVSHPGSGSMPVNKKSTKVPFCPKEVNRILESEFLSWKNAQSHTIRKIIVFASLGIRYGCDDMYELDFNHFSISRKGEPYVSPKNPGEHVLYEKPGVRRKVFYPNRQNPTLCPVKILEEENAMRPSDPSCPSCLFLCMKYGGRTRNLPQNEYVRQRMGRNKLKSFGPVMCQMAMLVHIRSGSFFFKALGITLLFMAGFPDVLVQSETKYQNLDLLQKYYRTDEDAEREELFLPHQTTCDTHASPGSQQLTGKTTSTKSKVRKQSNATNKPNNAPRFSVQQSAPSTVGPPPTQFGLMDYASIQANGMTAFQSTPVKTRKDTLVIPNQVINNSGTNVTYHNQTPYHMFPPHSINTFMPMIYWPPATAFPPGPYTNAYAYQSFPSYASIHPQSYNSLPSCSTFIPKMVEGSAKNNLSLKETDSDSTGSTSSNTDPKEVIASLK